MFRRKTVNKILFEWDRLETDEIRRYCKNMQVKLLRWLGANHPDNKTRKIFFDMTNVTIGEDTVINQNFIVSDNYLPLLKIGKRVAISPNVTIICASSPNNSLLSSISYVNQNLICEKEVIIEDDVWIGTNVVVMPGIILGRGSIIGAGSVVTRNVESNTIYAGIPAKKIRDLK